MKSVAVDHRRSRPGPAFRRRIQAFVTSRSRIVAIAATVLGNVIFAVPILQMFKPGTAHWPAFLLSGDIRMYLFPQYVAGYYRFWHGGISGLDFATDGGASVFGFRPNMPQFYPPYLFTYLFFDVARLDVAAALLSALQLLHVAVAIYFTVRLGTRFLSLRRGSAVLLALVYALSYTTGEYYFYFLYFFQVALMPLVAYALCDLMFRRRAVAAIIASPIFITYFLTNYGPTMAMGLIAALTITVAVFVMHLRPRLHGAAYARLILPLGSLALAGIVVLPFYVGEQVYHQLASTVPRDIATTAFSGAFTGTDLLSAFSWLLPGGTPTEGSLHWGLLPPLVLTLGLFVLAGTYQPTTRLRPLLFVSLGIFAAFVFICFGQATIVSDIFYTLVPVLGSMHLFQRYMMFGQFFLWLSVAIAAQVFSVQASGAVRQVGFLVVTGLWLVLTVTIGLVPGAAKVANGGWFLVEGALFLVGALILLFGRSSLALAALALPIVATSLWPVFGQTRALGVPEFWDTHMSYDKGQLDTLSRAFDAGDGKVLPKVLDLTADVDSYLGRNEPWLLFSRNPVMNFLGYEPHLAMDTNYYDMMGGYGHFDRNWVLHAGVDFVVWNAASEADLKTLTADTVSATGTKAIGNGTYVSHIDYKEPISSGSFTSLISIPQSNPDAWKLATLEDWKAVEGRAVKIKNGVSGNLSVACAPTPGQRYGISFTVLDSTGGRLALAFGNVQDPEPVPGDKPGHYTRTFLAKEPGGLWINGSSDFDGAVTDIVIRQLPDTTVEDMPVVSDNGVLRLESGDRASTMTHFDANWTKRVSADFDAASQARIVYELWPIPYMVPYLDGQAVSWTRIGQNPGFLDVPPGHHHLDVVFKSTAATLFAAFSYSYMLIYVVTAAILILKPPFGRWWRHRTGHTVA